MDIGGRKMAAFASGCIDAFQYFGAALAIKGLGYVLDAKGWGYYFYYLVPFGVVGGMLMAFGGAVLSLSLIGAWTEGLTGGRGWIALGLVTFANWHPLLAIVGTLVFGGFEAAQFRLPGAFPGAQYLLGIFPYLAPIVTLPLIAHRVNFRRGGAPLALGRPYFREERG